MAASRWRWWSHRLLHSGRAFSGTPALSRRILQTENEIVKMFRLPTTEARDSGVPPGSWPRLSVTDPSKRELDERFLRILKIFKWGTDAEKALDVLKLKVDHRLVREVLSADVDVNTKSRFFQWASRRKNYTHDSTTYMALIRSLADAGLVGELWRAVQEMVRNAVVVITPAELSEIVRILGRAKMVRQACSVFYQVKARKCRPTARCYNAMIVMLMCEGQYEKVHELYNEMCGEGGGCLPDTATYDALITTFCKLGREDSARRVFDEMKENRMQPRPKMYTNLISLCFRSGKVDEALKLFREMRDGSCPPNVFTYTELIRGLGKAGRVDDALSVFYEMRRHWGCDPDVVLMNNLLNVLGKSGRVADVVNLFNEMESMQSCPPNVVSFNTVIKALFDSRSPVSEVNQWVDKMKERGIQPSDFTYSILIDGFCKTNRVEKALMLLEEMDERGFPPCPAAYCSLIDALGRAGRHDAAGELFQELREGCGHSSSRVYAVMIKHLGRCSRVGDAVGLFEEMKRAGCAPDVYAYNAVMAGMVRAGMVDEAASMLRTMQEEGCVPDLNSHNIILNGVAKAGGPVPAMQMLWRMKEAANTWHGVRPDAVSYNTVLGSLSHAGMFEEAAKLMREMNDQGFQYDLVTYRSILEAVGKVDEENGITC